ncbi:spore coat [Chlorella sorokiniana]|uniref:Spore coat n=1 Tax=Chlorella sorokiniana TaxID=3076 RepID=A0A2P6TRX6_CHLSO|nr:spore coat [Chlorella sorokiniana]|eukprot:PRW56820.1 spore coat [Chlorella sorokiniana]
MRRGLLWAALGLACLLAAASSAAAAPGARRSLAQAAAAPASQPSAAPAAPAPAAEGGACCEQLAAIGFSSNLPVVVLDTAGQPLDTKGKDVPVRMCTCNSGQPFKDYEGLASASVRGTTSANATKKSFAVTLQQPDNKSKAARDGGSSAAANGNSTGKDDGLKSRSFAFLGMPADEDWILYGGDEVDLTQGMRNWLTYNLARASGRYASRTVWVEVFLVDNGAPLSLDDYHGIYIGLEKLKIAKQRVNVSKLVAPNLSGGYLLSYENDNIEAGDVTLGPIKGWDHPVLVKDPKKNATVEALAWLTQYFQAFQDALEAPDWLRGSVYMHKDRDGPLAAGPAWDYNEAYGLCCGYPIEGWDKQGVSGPGQAGGSAISPEGWRFLICADQERCQIDPTDGISRWYRRMWQDPRFSSGAAQRWAELRAGPWSDAQIDRMFTETTAQIKPAVLRNFDKYSAVLLKPWYSSAEQEWTSEVANLQSWLSKHLAWLDGEFAKQASSGNGPASVSPAAGR